MIVSKFSFAPVATAAALVVGFLHVQSRRSPLSSDCSHSFLLIVAQAGDLYFVNPIEGHC